MQLKLQTKNYLQKFKQVSMTAKIIQKYYGQGSRMKFGRYHLHNYTEAFCVFVKAL